MARPSQLDQRRKELLPVVAKAFSELGYRRATTAGLAARCEVQENILYRLWEDKRAMFLDAIQFLYEKRMDTWHKLVEDCANTEGVVERLINYEEEHLGEGGLYRVIFAGLGETDDPEISKALRQMYRRYQEFIVEILAKHSGDSVNTAMPSDDNTAWAIIGLGTMLNILSELDLMGSKRQRLLFTEVAQFLVERRKE